MRGEHAFIMGGHLIDAVAVIDFGLKDLDFLFGELGPAQLFDKFFGFTAEHTADYDFDPTGPKFKP